MKISRTIHIRLPLILKRYKDGKEITPQIVPSRASRNGGATVLIEGDTENPGLVQLRVAFCKKSDNYCRKMGRSIANAKDPEVVALRDLPNELKNIEDEMLCNSSTYLRKHEEKRLNYIGDWDFMVRYFLPKV